MVWHMEWNLNDWLLRPAEAEEKGFQKRHLSLERQLPGALWSPRRPVLAKTSIFTEKNTAKKLTLGDWRQHSVIFAFLWSYFQVLKSSLKKKKTHILNCDLKYFLFPGSGSNAEMDWKWHVCLTLVCTYVFHSVAQPAWNKATQQINDIKTVHPGLLSHLPPSIEAQNPFENMWLMVYYLVISHILKRKHWFSLILSLI